MSKKNNNSPEEEANIMTLIDEDGNQQQFEMIDTVQYDGRDFAVLLPYSEDEESENEMLYVLEIVEDLDDPEYDNYIGIEDDETIDAVFEIFKKRYFED